MIDEITESKVMGLIDKLDELLPQLTVIRNEINNTISAIKLIKGGIMPNTDKTKLRIITRAVLQYFDVTLTQIQEKSRKSDFIRPRQILTCLLVNHTTLTLTKIGVYTKRDHATVIHTKKVLSDSKDTKGELYKIYSTLEKDVLSIFELLEPSTSEESTEES